jgi:hypothetical protein
VNTRLPLRRPTAHANELLNTCVWWQWMTSASRNARASDIVKGLLAWPRKGRAARMVTGVPSIASSRAVAPNETIRVGTRRAMCRASSTT